VFTEFLSQAKEVYENSMQEKQRPTPEQKVTQKGKQICFLFTKMANLLPDKIPEKVLSKISNLNKQCQPYKKKWKSSEQTIDTSH